MLSKTKGGYQILSESGEALSKKIYKSKTAAREADKKIQYYRKKNRRL